MSPQKIPFHRLVSSNGKRDAVMRKRLVHIAIAVFAVALFAATLLPSTAQAAYGACSARSAAIGAEANRMAALLKRTGDCSLLPKIIALEYQFAASGRATPGCIVSLVKPIPQYTADLRKFCRKNVAQKPSPANSKTSEKELHGPAKGKAAQSKPEIASKEAPPTRARPGPKQAPSQAKGPSSKPQLANNAPDTKAPTTASAKSPSEPTKSPTAGLTPANNSKTKPPTSPNVTTANLGSEATPASPKAPVGPASTERQGA